MGDDSLEGLKRLAREVVYQTPEVRPDKVARLKEAIDQGTYEIDSAKLADILRSKSLDACTNWPGPIRFACNFCGRPRSCMQHRRGEPGVRPYFFGQGKSLLHIRPRPSPPPPGWWVGPD